MGARDARVGEGEGLGGERGVVPRSYQYGYIMDDTVSSICSNSHYLLP